MTWADGIAIVGNMVALALLFVGITRAAARRPPLPPSRREEPMRWIPRTTPPRMPLWTATRQKEHDDDE